MSRDGLLPPVFAKLHPRFRTPHITTAITGLVVATAAGLARQGYDVRMLGLGRLEPGVPTFEDEIARLYAAGSSGRRNTMIRLLLRKVLFV